MTEFSFICKTVEDKANLGNYLHDKLVGCRDYIDSNIVLNIDEDYVVRLIVDFDNTMTIPVITFHNRKSRFGLKKFEVHLYIDETKGDSDFNFDTFEDMFEHAFAVCGIIDYDVCSVAVESNVNGRLYNKSYMGIEDGDKMDVDINFVSKEIRFNGGNLMMSVID